MLVPQAMAYAELGGLPPSAGFRAALVALPVYALTGAAITAKRSGLLDDLGADHVHLTINAAVAGVGDAGHND